MGEDAAAAAAEDAECRVVVVGGGFAGLTLCRLLLSSPHRPRRLSVSLVEPRDYFEYTPGILRALVRPSHHPTLMSRIDHLPLTRAPGFTHVRAVASSVSLSERLVVAGEQRLPFDFVVLAAGSAYDAELKPLDLTSRQSAEGEGLCTPISASAAEPAERTTPSGAASAVPFIHSMQHRLSSIQQLHTRLVAASTIIIVGAGLVGVVRPSHTTCSSPRAHSAHHNVTPASRLCHALPLSVCALRRCALCGCGDGGGGGGDAVCWCVV